MTAHEGGGVKVLKVNARYLEGGEVLLERDSIAPLNFGEILNFVIIASSPPKLFGESSEVNVGVFIKC